MTARSMAALDELAALMQQASRINVRYTQDNCRTYRDTEDALTPERVLAMIEALRAATRLHCLEGERRDAFDTALAKTGGAMPLTLSDEDRAAIRIRALLD